MISGRKLFENSILYSFSGILTKCLNFILLPIYTASLTVEDYGIYSLIGSFVSAALHLVTLGLENAITRFHCEHQEDPDKLRILISTCVFPVLIMDVLLMSLCVVFRDFLCGTVLGGVAFFPFVLIGLIELSCMALNNLYRGVLRTEGSGRKMTVSSLCMFAVSTVLTLVLVVCMKCGAAGMLAAIAASRALLTVYGVFDLVKRKLIGCKVEFGLLKKVVRYSVPLVPHEASGYIATFSAKVFLSRAAAMASVGVYNLSSQIALVIDTVQDSFGHAFRPWLNETLTKRPADGSRKIRQMSEMTMALFGLLTVCVSLFAFEVIVLFFDESYGFAWKLIPILALAVSTKSIYYLYIFKCLYFVDTAKKIFAVSLIGSFANILLAYYLTPVFGMVGTALAQLASDALRAAGVIVLAGTREKIGYRLGRLLSTMLIGWVVVAAGVLPVVLLQPETFHWGLFCYKVGLVLAYAGFYGLKYKKTLLQLIRKPGQK